MGGLPVIHCNITHNTWIRGTRWTGPEATPPPPDRTRGYPLDTSRGTLCGPSPPPPPADRSWKGGRDGSADSMPLVFTQDRFLVSLCFQLFPGVFQPQNIRVTLLPLTPHRDTTDIQYPLNHNHKYNGACCKNFIPLLSCVSHQSFFQKPKYVAAIMVHPLVSDTKKFHCIGGNLV